jgi:hypothetical protein
MGVLDTMKRLDARVIPGFRKPGEAAEAFLRRAARRPWLAPANAWEVRYALREYFADLDGEG